MNIISELKLQKAMNIYVAAIPESATKESNSSGPVLTFFIPISIPSPAVRRQREDAV